jgi:nucleoside-diphosphate-sugar epimerase
VLGRRLLPQLREAGHEVVGMTRSEEKAGALREAGAEPVVCDAFDGERLHETVGSARPDAVVHELTDIPKAINPRKLEEQFATNDRLRSEGTRNLADAAAAAGARRLVAQSIAFAYTHAGDGLKSEDDPLFLDAPPPFRRSVEALRDLEEAVTGTVGIEGVVLRYGYFYGPGTAFASDGSSAEMVRKRRYPIVGRGTGVWSFIHVDDAARATVLALERGSPGAYNVVDDEPAPVSEWLPAYAEALGAKPPRRVPKLLARIAAGRYGTAAMTTQRGASNAKAKRELGWEPRYPSWRQGFREALG